MTASRPWVVKIGGALCEDPEISAQLAAQCRAISSPLVVVHGGGRQVSDLQKRLGLTPRFIDGRRVTGPEDLEAIEMALSGLVNHALVRCFTAAGHRAVGLSAGDAGMVACRTVSSLGRVGEPEHVETDLLRHLLSGGYTPIVSPIGLAADGGALNINADELAGPLAAAISAERLFYLSEVPGVERDGAVLVSLTSDECERAVTRGEITGGMIPKVRSALAAAASGVSDVRIAGWGTGNWADMRGTRMLVVREAAGAR
jgi:acetylglutamate kinase